MKISIEWLKDYVDIPCSIEDLKAGLTTTGLVVESVAEVDGDTVFEFEITSNRPDCLSHFGIAREIAALYGVGLKRPPLRRVLGLRKERLPYKVEIRDPDLCPRYTGLLLDKIKIEPSPDWMQRRLLAAGMRPVNNIVDITNYVLLELGHPLHAFDYHKLRQQKIVVARASEGEQITTLDGVDRTLDGEMLLIRDGEGPIAVAGVMGGQDSEISPETTAVLLECAYFKPSSVRRTSKKLGLSSEASYRFERGADWNGTVPSIARTCHLIEAVAGGRVAGSLQDVYPAPLSPVAISLSRQRVERLLGVELEDVFIETTLRRLEFTLKRKGKGNWLVYCPSYRADMELEADLAEEIARFYGYQNIPTTIPPSRSAGIPSKSREFESAAKRILTGLGFSEAVNLSFAAAGEHLDFPPLGGDRTAVSNPLTEETQFMRTSLAAGLMKAVRHNFNYQTFRIRLFELGRAYFESDRGSPVEKDMLGIAASGDSLGSNWRSAESACDFFQLKGAVESLLCGMRCGQHKIEAGAAVSWLNPAEAATLSLNGEYIGVLGRLSAALEEKYKFKQPVYLAELEFGTLSRHAFKPVQYEALPRFPAVERDLSMLFRHGTTFHEVTHSIRGLSICELTAISLIDVYEGDRIPAGKISLTLRFSFLDRSKTLTVDRVQGFSDNIVALLKDTFDAELR